MKEKFSTIVVGYYGAGNAGDELLLKMILGRLPSQANAIVLSVNPAHTRALHKVNAISLYKLDEVFEHMLVCQLLILGGGGLLQTHDRFTQNGLLNFSKSEVSAYIRPLLMAQQLGLRTLVWAQGVGPLDTLEAAKIAQAVFLSADAVSIRDAESLKLLRSLAVKREMLLAPDPIWAMPLPNFARTVGNSVDTKKNLVITLRPWASQTDFWKKNIAAAIDQCLDPKHFRITWLPFVIDGDFLDPEVTRVEKEVVESVQAHLLSEFDQSIFFSKSVDELLHQLRLADYAICMRLHAQILYHLQSTPVVSIHYDQKMKSASDDVQQHATMCLTLSASPIEWQHALSKLLTLNSEQLINMEKRDSCVASAAQHIEVLDKNLDDVNENLKGNDLPIEQAHFDWLKTWLKHQPELQDSVAKIGLDQALLKIESLNVELNRVHRDSESQRLAMHAMKSSWSWRVTRPLRLLKYFFHSPKKAMYFAAKTVYWHIPSRYRGNIYPLRNLLLRWFQGRAFTTESVKNSADISWDVFAKRVLANRKAYQGIFIQECVIDWAVPLYQRPQHIAAAMGRLNFLVIYRTNNWSDDNVHGFRLVAPNVWLTNSDEVDMIEAALRSIYSTAVVDQHRIAQFPKSSAIVYEYIDHIDPEISGDSENILRLTKQKERMIAGGAHFFVASAVELAKDIAKQVDPEKIFLIPNGVDASHYRSRVVLGQSLPDSYVEFCEKFQIRVGYFGALAPWLDYVLINQLVQLRPDIGFIFIGPDYYGGQAQLSSSPNVLMTGAIHYSQLPAYAARFDVCWIPFKPGDIAKSTSPLKLFEYFALEKPVIVTSDMQECTAYEDVLHANSSQAVSEKIDIAFLHKLESVGFVERLRHLADENDWSRRAVTYAQLFELMTKK